MFAPKGRDNEKSAHEKQCLAQNLVQGWTRVRNWTWMYCLPGRTKLALCPSPTNALPQLLLELKSTSYNKVPDSVLEAQFPSGSPMSSQFFISYWDEQGEMLYAYLKVNTSRNNWMKHPKRKRPEKTIFLPSYSICRDNLHFPGMHPGDKEGSWLYYTWQKNIMKNNSFKSLWPLSVVLFI